MTIPDNLEEAVDVLQQLGLKEYEARCFVGLVRLHTGTAKRLDELTEVPRTRVYDAIRVLQAQGLVEIQHSSPQQYRAVPLEEAIGTLRDRHEDQIERLHDALEPVETAEPDDPPAQQVWAISDRSAIDDRTLALVERATDEVALVLGDGSLLSDEVVDALHDPGEDVTVRARAISGSLPSRLESAAPDVEDPVPNLGEHLAGGFGIGRVLLADRSAILVSSIDLDTGSEQAIISEGPGNSLVVVARCLLSQDLPSRAFPK